ncbi:MAG: acyl-CoA thioesterase [Gammaproteobacteria bacterium]|nr:acyl-CoA thioesterase [Gammaproteobacteria bacterium]
MINELEIEVSAVDIDELGHVNNARFLEYFERGRVDWYNRCGDFLDATRKPRLGTVVVNINVNFRLECFEGDRLKVYTRPRSRGRRSYVLAQRIESEAGDIVADAEVTSVVMDLDARRTVSMPEVLAQQFGPAPGAPAGE